MIYNLYTTYMDFFYFLIFQYFYSVIADKKINKIKNYILDLVRMQRNINRRPYNAYINEILVVNDASLQLLKYTLFI
jgi:hypothetical protein